MFQRVEVEVEMEAAERRNALSGVWSKDTQNEAKW